MDQPLGKGGLLGGTISTVDPLAGGVAMSSTACTGFALGTGTNSGWGTNHVWKLWVGADTGSLR